MKPPTVAIVGYSDSGKTRVATALIRLLVAKGYRIAAVKHASHGHMVDRPGTDSERLLQAGAATVILSSPGQKTSIEMREEDNPLEQIVSSLDSDYDLVIVEGFKNSSAPKVLVTGVEALSSLPQGLVAVVSDQEKVEGIPNYAFQDMESLAKLIEVQIMHGR
ncbi:MAG: molybdopterin-guanine dinucleotide biosynthesis protein B [Chloroflexi bacterium]|nr:molybdopterin-guanine dinucleotide biosynthesis protein B [Chloroflexota bacterium]